MLNLVRQIRLGARVETLIRMQRLKIEDSSKTKTSSGTSAGLKRHKLVGWNRRWKGNDLDKVDDGVEGNEDGA